MSFLVMRPEARRRLWGRLGVLLVAWAATAACSSGSSAVIDPVTAAFAGSGTAAAPSRVRLTGSAAGDTVVVDVVITGPTAGADLYSFAFDLVLGDAAVAEYVSGSQALGGALTLGGGQTAQVLASQNGNRITLGVTKLGGGAGNDVPAGDAIVCSVTFRMLKKETTTLSIAGTPPQAPAALNSAGGNIGNVSFDSAAAMLSGS